MKEVEETELNRLLNGIERRYGYDFRDYARASRKRIPRPRYRPAIYQVVP